MNIHQSHSIFDNITRYNKICNDLGSNFASLNHHFEKVQEILIDCTNALQTLEESSFVVKNTSDSDKILFYKNVLIECRKKLMDEQMKIVDNKLVMMKSGKGFNEIWTGYLELEHELAVKKDEILKLRIGFGKKEEENEIKVAKHVNELNKEKQKIKEELVTLRARHDEDLRERMQQLEKGYYLKVTTYLDEINRKKQQLEKEYEIKVGKYVEELNIKEKKLKEEKVALFAKNKQLDEEKLSIHKTLEWIDSEKKKLFDEKQKIADEKKEIMDQKEKITEEKEKIIEKKKSLQNLETSYNQQFKKLETDTLTYYENNQLLLQRSQILLEESEKLKKERNRILEEQKTQTNVSF